MTEPSRKSPQQPEEPWRPVGQFGMADQGTTEAVRRVIADWDGQNWSAVRIALRAIGRTDDQIDRMDEMAVRMEFAINQRTMIMAIGGRANTTESTIIPVLGADQGVLTPRLLAVPPGAATPANEHSVTRSADAPAPAGSTTPDEAMLSPASLLTEFGLPDDRLNALNKRLQRYREKHLSGWIENKEATSREASFLYQVGAVRYILLDLKATSGATSK